MTQNMDDLPRDPVAFAEQVFAKQAFDIAPSSASAMRVYHDIQNEQFWSPSAWDLPSLAARYVARRLVYEEWVKWTAGCQASDVNLSDLRRAVANWQIERLVRGGDPLRSAPRCACGHQTNRRKHGQWICFDCG